MDVCRICYEPTRLISPCRCDGTSKYVHLHCLQTWINVSKRQRCELCDGLYKHPQLTFPRPIEEKRLESYCFLTAVFGIIHGLVVWVDTYYGVDTIWASAVTSTMFNSTQLILAIILRGMQTRHWRIHCTYLGAFVLGNIPGHIVSNSFHRNTMYAYVFNVAYFLMFMLSDSITFGCRG